MAVHLIHQAFLSGFKSGCTKGSVVVVYKIGPYLEFSSIGPFGGKVIPLKNR